MNEERLRKITQEEIKKQIMENKEEVIKNYNRLIHNAKANWIYEDYEILANFLDLYNIEKEKNKELENADLTSVYMSGFYDGEKKWKDKIKAEIKEIKNTCYYNEGDATAVEQVFVLEKLLEK